MFYKIIRRKYYLFFFVFIFCASIIYAQPNNYAFGRLNYVNLSVKHENTLYCKIENSFEHIFISWTSGKHDILISSLDKNYNLIKSEVKFIDYKFDTLLVSDFNNDKRPDILLFNTSQQKCAIIFLLDADTLKVSTEIKIPIFPQNILLSDYNDDSFTDILIYSNNSLGILPVVIKNNKLKITNMIAADVAVGAADIVNINDDNLCDIILSDWVKSELNIFYGVGKGKFVCQSVFPIEGEADFISTKNFSRTQTQEFTIKTNNSSQIQLWEWNDFGDFKFKQNINFDGTIKSYCYADLNNDSIKDISAIVNNSLSVALLSEADTISEKIIYSAGLRPKNIYCIQNQNNKHVDFVVFEESENRLMIFQSANKSVSMQDSIMFATGLMAKEIISHDFNKDGVFDLAVINENSQSVSVFSGNKNESPYGPLIYTFSNKPKNIVYHSTVDSTINFVLSFNKSLISYFTLNTNKDITTNAIIGCEGDSRIISTKINSNNKAEFITLNKISTKEKSISYYEQIEAETFIERNFRILPPEYLISAAAIDLNKDNYWDIVYLYKNKDSSYVDIGIALGDSLYSMKHRYDSKVFNLKNVTDANITLNDLDKDGILDLIMTCKSEDNTILMAKGDSNYQFKSSKIIADKIVSPIEFELCDIDNDGLTDMVCLYKETGKFVWYKNLGEFNFSDEKYLFADIDVNSFTISDIDADGLKDLSYTTKKLGAVKIISGKILPIKTTNQ